MQASALLVWAWQLGHLRVGVAGCNRVYAGPAVTCLDWGFSLHSDSIRNARKCIVANWSPAMTRSEKPWLFRTKRAGVTVSNVCSLCEWLSFGVFSIEFCHGLEFRAIWCQCLGFRIIWFIPLLGVPSYLIYAIAWSSEIFDLCHCLEFRALWFMPLLGVPSYLIYATAWSS